MRNEGEVGMKITQSWKHNMPSADGFGITVTYVYESKRLSEIEELEKRLPRGTIIMDTDEVKRTFPLKGRGSENEIY